LLKINKLRHFTQLIALLRAFFGQELLALAVLCKKD